MVAHGAASGGGGGRTQLLATVEVLAMTVLTVSSPVFFYFSLPFFFFFLSRFSPLYPYSAPLFFLFIPLFFLLCFPSLLPLFFFFSFSLLVFHSLLCFFFFRSSTLSCALSLFVLVSPVFIGEKQGGRGRGCHCAAAPKTARGARPLCFSPPRGSRRIRVYASGVMVGIFLMFKRERDRIKIDENRGKKNMLLLLPRTSRGRRRSTVPFKTTSFGSLFFSLNNV